jgi:hypothetical protein
MSERLSLNMTVVRRAFGRRRWRGSTPPGHQVMCHWAGGCASLMTAAGFLMTAGRIVRRRLAGGRSTCSDATASRRCYAHRRVFGIRLDVEETRALQLEHFPVGLNRGDSQVLSPRRV